MEEDKIQKTSRNIDGHIRYNWYEVEKRIKYIQKSESLNDLLGHKEQLLYKMLHLFPLNAIQCPYCLVYVCNDCPYGKRHGICYLSGTDYAQLTSTYQDLLYYISMVYSIREYTNDLNEDALNQVKEKLSTVDQLMYNIGDQLNKISICTSAAHLLQHKADIMLAVLDHLPIGANTCYFCYVYDSCDNCPVNILYGSCHQPKSQHYKLCSVVRDLREYVKKYAEM